MEMNEKERERGGGEKKSAPGGGMKSGSFNPLSGAILLVKPTPGQSITNIKKLSSFL